MGLTDWKGHSDIQLDRADAGIKLPAGDRLDQCRSLKMLSMAAACFSCRHTGTKTLTLYCAWSMHECSANVVTTYLVTSSVPDAAAHRPAALVVQDHAAEPGQLAPDAHEHPPLPYRPRRRAQRARSPRRRHRHGFLRLQHSAPCQKPVARAAATATATHHHVDGLLLASPHGLAAGVGLVLPQSHGQAEPHGSSRAGAAKSSQCVCLCLDRDAERSRPGQCSGWDPYGRRASERGRGPGARTAQAARELAAPMMPPVHVSPPDVWWCDRTAPPCPCEACLDRWDNARIGGDCRVHSLCWAGGVPAWVNCLHWAPSQQHQIDSGRLSFLSFFLLFDCVG